MGLLLGWVRWGTDLDTGCKSEQRWDPAKELERKSWTLTGDSGPFRPVSAHTCLLRGRGGGRGGRVLLRNWKSQELVSC